MKMNLLLALFVSAITASAADFAQFTRAVHLVETSGRTGPIIGDGGRALGPLQVHRGCWEDSRVGGRYEDVADLAVATAVLRAYLTRYALAHLLPRIGQRAPAYGTAGPRAQLRLRRWATASGLLPY